MHAATAIHHECSELWTGDARFAAIGDRIVRVFEEKDEDTLREARVLAAERGLSVSAFLRAELAGLVERQRGYGKARESAVRRLRRGHTLGDGNLPSRDELHDRASLR